MKDWPVVSVEEIADRSQNAMSTGPFGSSIGSRFFRSTGVPVIRGSNLSIDSETRFSDDGLVFLDPDKAAEFSRSTARQGDLIFTCWGTINQVGLLDGTSAHNQYVISNKQMKFTPDRMKASAEYLYYLFSAPALQQEILGGAIGTSIPGFNLTRLRSLRFPLPPFSEQIEIARILTTAEQLVSQLKSALLKKRNIRQGMQQELLSGRVRLQGFSNEWSLTRLRCVASGDRGAGLSKGDIRTNGEYPCILYGELFTTYGRVVHRVMSSTNRQGAVVSRGSEVLLPGSTTTSAEDLATATALLQAGVLLGGDINIIRPNRAKVDPVWLAYYLVQERSRQIAESSQGITIVHLYVKSLLDLEIALPSLEEQQAIAKVLLDVDSEISALERQLKSARAIKQGMMQELLTGRTRLTAEAAP